MKLSNTHRHLILPVFIVFSMATGCSHSKAENAQHIPSETTEISDERLNDVDSCISRYLESTNNYILKTKDIKMDTIDYLSITNTWMIFICNAKYNSEELNYNDVVHILRTINQTNPEIFYEFKLQSQSNTLEIPVVSKKVSENFALNITHYVYMKQNYTVDNLFKGVQMSTSFPDLAANDETTYNYLGCYACSDSIESVTLRLRDNKDQPTVEHVWNAF